MIAHGAFSKVDITAVVGSVSDAAIASSVFTHPSRMSGSVYICAGTPENPIAGPPARISTSTPVHSPFAMRGPETLFLPASMVASGPSRVNRPPCSAWGFQSVWMTTVAGHTPERSTAPMDRPAPDDGASALPVEAQPERTATTIAAAARVDRGRVDLGMGFS